MEITQRDLAALVGAMEQTLRLWEKHRGKPLPGSPDRLVRAIYSEYIGGDGTVRRMLDRLAELDQVKVGRMSFQQTNRGWKQTTPSLDTCQLISPNLETPSATSMKYKKIAGQIGSWFVDVMWEDGSVERLPCANKYWWQSGTSYHDPLTYELNGGPALDDRRMQEWLRLARTCRKVAVQKDVVNKDKPEGGEGFFDRDGYVGVFDIGEVTANYRDGLRFSFLNRHEKLP
jgi:hypothetical protein